MAVIHEDYDKAVKFLERALSMRPADAQVLNNLAVALVRQNPENTERALKLAEQALELAPEHPELICTRAEVLMALERWQDARRDLDDVLRRSPGHELATQLMQELKVKAPDTSP